jgi:hypothetical protein
LLRDPLLQSQATPWGDTRFPLSGLAVLAITLLLGALV